VVVCCSRDFIPVAEGRFQRPVGGSWQPPIVSGVIEKNPYQDS
jgi:hypothetical protein